MAGHHPGVIGAMDLGPAQAQESTLIVDDELQWLDDLLADGRSCLAGDQFSRADLTAASLLAPLARPNEHPTVDAIELPPRIAKIASAWQQRRSM